MLGFRFAPRLRDLGDRKLYTIEKPSSYPDLNLLIGGAVNVKQITGSVSIAKLRRCVCSDEAASVQPCWNRASKTPPDLAGKRKGKK